MDWLQGENLKSPTPLHYRLQIPHSQILLLRLAIIQQKKNKGNLESLPPLKVLRGEEESHTENNPKLIFYWFYKIIVLKPKQIFYDNYYSFNKRWKGKSLFIKREVTRLRATRAQKLQTKRLLVHAIDAPTTLNTPLCANRASTTLLLPFTIFSWTVIHNPPVLTFPTHLNI